MCWFSPWRLEFRSYESKCPFGRGLSSFFFLCSFLSYVLSKCLPSSFPSLLFSFYFLPSSFFLFLFIFFRVFNLHPLFLKNKNKKGLCDLYAVCVSRYPAHKRLNAWPSLYENCAWLHLYVARQRLGKNVTAATNTHTTIEELLDVSFSMRPVSYQREAGD
jgi:hypothetical protein